MICSFEFPGFDGQSQVFQGSIGEASANGNSGGSSSVPEWVP